MFCHCSASEFYFILYGFVSRPHISKKRQPWEPCKCPPPKCANWSLDTHFDCRSYSFLCQHNCIFRTALVFSFALGRQMLFMALG